MNAKKCAFGQVAPRSLPSWAVCLVAGLAAVLSAGPALADEPNVTIERILKVWEEREAATKSILAKWTEQRHYEIGSRCGKETRGSDDEGRPFPSRPIDVSLESLLRVDGERYRYEFQGENWVDRVEAVAPEHVLELFDGTRYLRFLGVDFHDKNVGHDNGWITMRTRSGTREWPVLAPIMANYRALAPGFGHFRRDEWSATSLSDGGTVDGMKCMALSFSHVLDPARTKRCWVAPSLGCRIVRLELGQRMHVEVHYETDRSGETIPKSWRYVLLQADGVAVRWSFAVAMREFAVNAPATAGDFSFEFPVGTEVVDLTKGPKPEVYVVREGRPNRVVTREERMTPQRFEDVLATESGDLARRRNALSYPVTAAVLGVLAIVTVVLALRLRRQRLNRRGS
ncbi:MAG: hypothetical protein HYS13_09285 [Planctomycetia bacterium]|nr:hypothetical protein [Planctomycetia bacterium]